MSSWENDMSVYVVVANFFAALSPMSHDVISRAGYRVEAYGSLGPHRGCFSQPSADLLS